MNSHPPQSALPPASAGADRRVHRRVARPPFVLTLAERSYWPLDASLGGFLIEDHDGGLTPEDRFEGRITPFGPAIVQDPEAVGFGFRAAVVRLEDGGVVAARFVDLDHAAMDRLTAYLASARQFETFVRSLSTDRASERAFAERLGRIPIEVAETFSTTQLRALYIAFVDEN
ncbi:MAG: PilZ domain-containing protein [Alphaproteobacteria bacterium]|nr:PilZ domain-containing protein [Alphaproteobacteria bacterium]